MDGKEMIETGKYHKELNHIHRVLLTIISYETDIPKVFFASKRVGTILSVNVVSEFFHLDPIVKAHLKDKYVNLICIEEKDGFDSLTTLSFDYTRGLDLIKEREFVETIDLDDESFELWFRLRY
jgi:hypothetical protein